MRTIKACSTSLSPLLLSEKTWCSSLVWFLLSVLVVGCDASREQLIQKAKEKMGNCTVAGGKLFKRKGKCLIWDLQGNTPHSAHSLLDSSLRYSSGAWPVTVFLVSAKQKQEVGKYNISRQPAYREWVNVCVVQFQDPNDTGTALGTHEVVSLDPRSRRPVQQIPEYGDPAPPIANWIKSLPTAD